jgi:hypothetical protein
VSSARSEVITDGVRDGTAEDDQVEKRVGTETVSTMDRDTSGLATSEQARNNLVVTLLINSEHLSSKTSGNTTHVVVDRREDGNGLRPDIDTGEDGSSL